MLVGSRCIWKDNAVLRDVTPELTDLLTRTVTFAYVAGEDHLFIGSDFPFNHRHFQVRTPNEVASAASIALWDGSDWQAVAEVIDETKDAAGASLARSGNIMWVPDQNKGWSREASTEDIPALSTLKIYNKYWVRIAWSVSLTTTTEVQYVGHKFAKDEDFRMQYPGVMLTKFMQAFDESKSNWDEQHILAAEQVVDALKANDALKTADQVLEPAAFRDAAVHKAAALIYAAFGSEWEVERRNANAAFEKALDAKNYALDQNMNARVDVRETVRSARVRRV